MRRPDSRRLADPDAEVVRRAHHDAIRDLQDLPATSLRVVGPVELPDGDEVVIAHGLGRVPDFVGYSVPRGPSTSGRIEEIRTGAVNRALVVVLKASGYGATVTVDLVVL